jgi:hypothetical protein
VGGAKILAFQVVAAGAEPVRPVEKNEFVVGAMIEVAGAAVSATDRNMHVAAGERLNVILVTGTASAVDAPFQGRGLREGTGFLDGRGGDNLRGGRRRGRFLSAAQIGHGAMAAHVAGAAAREVLKFEYQAGNAAAVERRADEPGIVRGVDLVAVAARQAAIRRSLSAAAQSFHMDLVDVQVPAPELSGGLSSRGKKGFGSMTLEAKGMIFLR